MFYAVIEFLYVTVCIRKYAYLNNKIFYLDFQLSKGDHKNV